MKGYSKLYKFDVLAAIRKGKVVLLVDLFQGEVFKATEVRVECFIEAIDDETGRYCFYEEKNSEVKEKKHE